MALRVVLSIQNECDIHVQRVNRDTVRVRITEKNTEIPTDFEIEGDPLFIADALSATATVLANLDSLLKENPS
jgi:hypothetical protein